MMSGGGLRGERLGERRAERSGGAGGTEGATTAEVDTDKGVSTVRWTATQAVITNISNLDKHFKGPYQDPKPTLSAR